MPFILTFDGADTGLFNFMFLSQMNMFISKSKCFNLVILSTSVTSATDLQTALNDLPTLSPNLVTNVTQRLSGNDKIFTIVFSAKLGLYYKLSKIFF